MSKLNSSVSKKKVYFYFSHIQHIGFYSVLINNLQRKEVVDGVILRDHNKEKLKLQVDSYTFIKVHESLLFWEDVLNNVRIRKQKYISNSFQDVSIRSTINIKTLKQKIAVRFIKQDKKHLLYAIKQTLRKEKYNIVESLLIRVSKYTWLFHNLFFWLKIRDKSYFQQLDKLEAKIIIFCHQGNHPDTHLLLKYGKQKGIKIIFFQHNWDNISSKEKLKLFPDRLLVWSYQTLLHATSILEMEESRVRVAGNFRLDMHLHAFNKRVICNLDSKQILYLGDSTNFNEVIFLRKLSEVLFQWGSDYYCLYRPHPYLRKEKFTRDDIPSNILVDNDFIEDYFQQSINSTFENRLVRLNSNNFVENIQNSCIVIGGGSTILLEALVLRVPVLFLNPIFGSKEVIYKTHFGGFSTFKGVVVLNEIDINKHNLEYSLGLLKKVDIDYNKLKYYYNFETDSNFENTLINTIKELL